MGISSDSHSSFPHVKSVGWSSRLLFCLPPASVFIYCDHMMLSNTTSVGLPTFFYNKA